MGLATVRNHMTLDVVVLRPEDGFKQIIRALAERGVSGAPVVDETGRVMGVVSEADLLHKDRKPAYVRPSIRRSVNACG